MDKLKYLISIFLIVIGIGMFKDFQPFEFNEIVAALLIAIGLKLK